MLKQSLILQIIFFLLNTFIAYATPLNYTAGYGEMELYNNYYFNHKPVPEDTLWPGILMAAGVSISANDTIKPYIISFIDKEIYSSGLGSQFLKIQRTASDTKDRTVTLNLAYIDTTTNSTFGLGTNFPFGDSLIILLNIKADSVQNVTYRLRVRVNSSYNTIQTWNSDAEWFTVGTSIFISDTVWYVRPYVDVIVNKNGNNSIKLWIDNLRMYSKSSSGEYRTLPVLPKANFKLVNFASTVPDWVTVIAKHDINRGDRLSISRWGQVKPEAELFHYVMTSAAYVRYVVRNNGHDTIWYPTYLGGGDFYPHCYMKDSCNWGFIRDSLGRVVYHLWPFNDTSFSREDYVRYGIDGEFCRNIFYKNLKWLYDSAYTFYKPKGFYFDNFLHPIYNVPDRSPDYETRQIREQKHLDFTQNLKARFPNLPFFAGLSTSYFNVYSNYIDYIMRCSFTVSCEFGAGKWVSPKETYNWIKIINQNTQKKYILLAGVVNEQQILYTVSAFYMVNGENVYVLMHDTSSGKYCHYRCTIYPSYYYLPIGQPAGDPELLAYTDTINGLVFLRRNYSNGVVLLNLDTLNSYTYIVDKNYLNHDGIYIDSGEVIIVAPRNGYLLYVPIYNPIDDKKLFYVPLFFNEKIEIKYLGSKKGGLDIKVYNAMGRLVFYGNYKCNKQIIIKAREIQALSQGVYFLVLSCGNREIGKAKIIKVKSILE
uniref:T9SS type A sorting domain-containing protein n=1 Tax=candidate division WOR-3 bacterium TaxID=2052148 RepID=A0A7V1EIR6_UNCW3